MHLWRRLSSRTERPSLSRLLGSAPVLRLDIQNTGALDLFLFYNRLVRCNILMRVLSRLVTDDIGCFVWLHRVIKVRLLFILGHRIVGGRKS